MVLDLDEFVHLPGLHDIERALDAVENGHDAVHLNRIGFGNSGFRTRPPGGTLRNFVRRQQDLSPVTRALLRSSRLRLEPHRPAPIWTDPASLLPAGARQVNLLGEPMPPPPRPRIDPDRAGRLMARGLVHHYPFRSEQDFLLRAARGVQGDFAGQARWRDLYAKGEHRAVLAQLDAQEDRALADFWAARIKASARRATLLPAPAWDNIALRKPARQSSVSPWSRGGDPVQDAAGLVNGTISGGFQCHTANEERAWWELDLGAPARVHEIRVFNRCDDPSLAERVRACALSASADGRQLADPASSIGWPGVRRRRRIPPGGPDARARTRPLGPLYPALAGQSPPGSGRGLRRDGLNYRLAENDRALIAAAISSASVCATQRYPWSLWCKPSLATKSATGAPSCSQLSISRSRENSPAPLSCATSASVALNAASCGEFRILGDR